MRPAREFAPVLNLRRLVGRGLRRLRAEVRSRWHRSRGARVRAHPVPGRHAADAPVLLLIAFYDPRGIQAVRDHVWEITTRSRHAFHVLNLFEAALLDYPLLLPADLDLSAYSGVMVHSSVSCNPDLLETMDASLRCRIPDYRGLKVLLKQDEQVETQRIERYVATAGFQVLGTCVPEVELGKVYPGLVAAKVGIVHTLTGYVTDAMRTEPAAQQGARPIDIGYRGSLQPWQFGRLGFEKAEIGERLAPLLRRRGLRCDISSRPEDRLPGDRWRAFLSRCKAVLGVESGASVFDLDGQLARRCAEFRATRPQAGFEEVEREILRPYEGRIAYGQVGPRHFEAAATRTVQILYEGRYSGIFEAGRHYLSLRRDLSNLEHVLERWKDEGERRRLTTAAWEDIVMDPRYHFSTFVDQLDEAIEERL